mgnify:CR=1 FL=1
MADQPGTHPLSLRWPRYLVPGNSIARLAIPRDCGAQGGSRWWREVRGRSVADARVSPQQGPRGHEQSSIAQLCSCSYLSGRARACAARTHARTCRQAIMCGSALRLAPLWGATCGPSLGRRRISWPVMRAPPLRLVCVAPATALARTVHVPCDGGASCPARDAGAHLDGLRGLRSQEVCPVGRQLVAIPASSCVTSCAHGAAAGDRVGLSRLFVVLT